MFARPRRRLPVASQVGSQTTIVGPKKLYKFLPLPVATHRAVNEHDRGASSFVQILNCQFVAVEDRQRDLPVNGSLVSEEDPI